MAFWYYPIRSIGTFTAPIFAALTEADRLLVRRPTVLPGQRLQPVRLRPNGQREVGGRCGVIRTTPVFEAQTNDPWGALLRQPLSLQLWLTNKESPVVCSNTVGRSVCGNNLQQERHGRTAFVFAIRSTANGRQRSSARQAGATVCSTPKRSGRMPRPV